MGDGVNIKYAEFWEEAIQYANEDDVRGVTVIVDRGDEQKVMRTEGAVVEKLVVVALKDLISGMIEEMCDIEEGEEE